MAVRFRRGKKGEVLGESISPLEAAKQFKARFGGGTPLTPPTPKARTAPKPTPVAEAAGLVDPDPSVAAIRTTRPSTPITTQVQLDELRTRQRHIHEAEAARIIAEGGKRGEVGLAREKEQAEAAFEEATGAGAFAEQLQQQIVEPPSLAPRTSEEVATQQQEFFDKLGRGEASKKEIREQMKLGAIGAGVAGALVSIPLMAAAGVGKAVTLKLGKFSGLGKLAAAAIGGKAAFDFMGGEMNTHRDVVGKVVEDGERIEAAVRNGLDPATAITILNQMSDEVNLAEKRLKELGEFNVQYRISKEYLEDMARVRSAREALLRRVLAVQNIAVTGQAAMNVEELLTALAEIL